MKLKLIWQDWLIIVGIGLNAGARFITNFLTLSLSKYVATANVLETNPNPAIKWAVTNYYLQFFTLVVSIGMLAAFYLYLRSKRFSDERFISILNTFTIMVFILFLFDFTNDMGSLFAVLFNH